MPDYKQCCSKVCHSELSEESHISTSYSTWSDIAEDNHYDAREIAHSYTSPLVHPDMSIHSNSNSHLSIQQAENNEGEKIHDSSPLFENEMPTSAPEPSTYPTDTSERELTQQSGFSSNHSSSLLSEGGSFSLTLQLPSHSLDSWVSQGTPQSQDSGIVSCISLE
ncbi:unnamed protein product [Hymenolepis diminuta]|uniref:Uncharacterized protein n=1 Tax=Hymenolepis diminuta TaxID=6216 RepID=A0A0R3SGS5_HYMDI|nr:unnamed protein product [Hymenolepis diminuta]